MDNEKIKKKLLQKAMGYDYKEITEEYVCEDGELKLLRKKINTKHNPADNNIIKLLLGNEPNEFEGLSEQELEKEKEKIIKELKREEKK